MLIWWLAISWVVQCFESLSAAMELLWNFPYERKVVKIVVVVLEGCDA